jgi:hypothetical protein
MNPLADAVGQTIWNRRGKRKVDGRDAMANASANRPLSTPSAYRDAVKRLVADCALLAGAPRKDGLACALEASLGSLPAMSDWRGRSRLCFDGAPVEIALHIGDRLRAPSLTLDPFLSLEGAHDPLARALSLATLARPDAVRSVENLRERLTEPSIPPHIRAAWLGLSLDPDASPARLYVDCSGTRPGADAPLRFRAPPEAAEPLPQGISGLGRAIGAADFSAGGLLTRIAAFGRFRTLAFDIGDEDVSSDATSAKASFALRLADRDSLRALAHLCGFKSDALLAYVGLLLRRGEGWRDRRCGCAVATRRDSGQRPCGLTFYHPLRPYLGGDDAIRVALIGVARFFGWDSGAFSALTRLVADSRDRSAFQLAGFTLSADGAAGVTLYAGTGHVAR